MRARVECCSQSSDSHSTPGDNAASDSLLDVDVRRIVASAFLALIVIAAFWLFEGDVPAAVVDARYTSVASQFLTTVDGARVHYRDEGNRSGTPVVLVHGANASLHTWQAWVALLGDEFRFITLDLPGHGLTGRVPNDDYSADAMAATVRAVAAAVGVERFVLGGNSIGGGVAWRYALERRDQVRALVLIDASGLWSWRVAAGPAEGDTPIAFRLLAQPWFRAVARYLDPYYLVEQGLRATYNNAAVIDDTLIRRYYDLAMREGTRAATLKAFSGIRVADADEPDLSQLTQPTLVMWGAQDALIPVAIAHRFYELLPRAELVVYEDVGHVPMEEAAEQSAADLRRFLRALDGDIVRMEES